MKTFSLGCLVVALALAGCGSEESVDTEGPGSSSGAGGAKAGASGSDAGGTDAGGTNSGGTSNGGTSNGGSSSGGTDAGGTDAGGTDAGGTDAGGTDAGGTDGGGQGGAAAGSDAGGSGGSGQAGSGTSTSVDPTQAPAVELTTWKGKLTPGFQGLDIVVTMPKGATGKLPLVVFAHGFQLGVNDYNQTLQHIAKFGYVVASVDFQGNFLDQDHHAPVDSMKQAIELLTKNPPAEVGAVVDETRIASMGHSLGGKGSIWAALELPEIRAVVAFDPVDDDPSPFPNSSPKRPSLAPEKMGDLKVPALFFGAQLSATGGMPCAPKASSACAFAASTPSSVFSRHYTLEQFGHMQFLDNSGCLTCLTCSKGPAPQEEAGRSFFRAEAVAFLEAELKGSADYKAYLDSAEALASGKNVIFDKTEQSAFCGP